jgi:hypothetical protein
MASTIKLKTGTGSAVPSALSQGEVGINIDNGLIYYGSGSGNHVKQLESFTSITASNDISASGTIITDKFKANLEAGVDNSVLIKDADGFIKTDEINSAVWGTEILTTAATEGTLDVASSALATNWTVGNATNATNATKAETQRITTNAEYFPVIVDSSNTSATNEALKTPTSGFTFNPFSNRLTITSASITGITSLGDISGSGGEILGFNSINTQTLTVGGLSNQGSEATAVMINGSNVVGTRELGSNAFTSTTIGTTTNALTIDNATLALNSGTTFNGSAAVTLAVKDGGIDSDALAADIAVTTLTATNITASGNISSSGNIIANGGAGAEFTVRPNLHWFATNTSATVGSATDGTFPATDTTKISWTEDICSHQDVFVFSSDALTITRAGLYKFSYNVTLEINNGSARTEGGISIVRTPNGGSAAIIDGSVTSTYNRLVAGGISRNTGASTVLINVAADDAFQIDFARIANSNSSTKLRTVTTGTSWYVEAVT